MPNSIHSHAVSFSVVVPALNEARVIGTCLEALQRLDFPADRFEVILVDNGSSDNTVAIARQFSSCLQIRVLEKRDVSIAALRNIGARAAQGEFLAFLDADCLAPVQWLTQALGHFAASGPVVLGAHYGIPAASSWVARIWYGHYDGINGDVSYVPSGDLLIRKSDFDRLGGFDESLQTSEDYEFCQRARAAAVPVRAFTELSVCHLGTPQTLQAFYRKQYWHGTHVFTVFLRSLPRLRNLAAVAVAVYFLLSITGLFAGTLVALVSGTYAWAAIFAAGGVLAAVALSLKTTLARRRPRYFLPLVLLFLTFGIARAVCLIAGPTARTTAAAIPGAAKAAESTD